MTIIAAIACGISAGCSGSSYSTGGRGQAADAAYRIPTGPCPPDAAQVGPTCIDVFEESVWQIPPDQTDLIARVQAGKATVADLDNGGAHQAPCGSELLNAFPTNGNWTDPLYAVSVEGVTPASCVTWLQAEQLCALSSKRLVTNQEWQRAAAGPTMGLPCAVSTQVTTTGTDACLSNWYVNDLGNGWESVAEWSDLATRINGDCAHWSSPYWGLSCVGGSGAPYLLGHLGYAGIRHRGGGDAGDTIPRIYNISDGDITTNRGYPDSLPIAFRCARPLPSSQP